MSLVFAWSKPGLGFIACDRQFADFQMSSGPSPVNRELGIKLKNCAKGFYGVAGTLIAGIDMHNTPYDIGTGAEVLNDPSEILQAYTAGYLSAYVRMGRIVEANQGEAKADLTMVVGDVVKVLEMNHGRANSTYIPHHRFTCSTPRDFSGSQSTFQRVLDLLMGWVDGRSEMKQAFTHAWSLIVPYSKQVSIVFDVGVTGQALYRQTFTL